MANPAIQSFLDSIPSSGRPTGTLNVPIEEEIDEPGFDPDIALQQEIEPPKQTAQEQADRIKLLVDAGKDLKGEPWIHKYYKSQMGKGWLGTVGSLAERATRKDLIPPEVEALLGEDYIKKLVKILGAGEFTTPEAESTFFEALLTRTFGRGGVEPSEAEKTAAARGGTTGYLDRLISEWSGKRPSEAAIRGEAPTGASPAVKALLKEFKYSPATDAAAIDIELRHYGRLPLKDPDRFKAETARANSAIRYMAELPMGVNAEGKKVSVAEDIVGKFLVADINSRYGTSDKQYTIEDLDLEIQKTASGKKLTFVHPTEGRQPIDPVTFDWGDVIDQMPMLTIIGSDILGTIIGGITGTKVAGPVGTFVGGTTGGALGAGIAKWFNQRRALEMGGFTFDGSKMAYIGKDAGGKDVSIPAMDIFMGPVTEAAWSAGGATLGSAIFRMARALFTRGSSEVDAFVNEKDFLDAYKRYGESKWGKSLDAEGIKAPPSVQMEAAARQIRQEADALPTGSEKQKLLAQAVRLEKSASGLRAFESTALPSAGQRRAEILEGLVGKTKEGISPAYFDSPAEFGKIVEKALQDGTGQQIKTILGQMNAANAKLADDWRNLFKGVDEGGDPRAFGESLRALSAKVLGTDTADAGVTKTGIYGTLNNLRAAGRRYNKSAWDLTNVAKGVEKEISSLKRVGGQAYPPAVQNYFLKLQTGSKAVNLDQLRHLNDLIEKEMKSAVGTGQRRLYRLSEKLRIVEGRGFKNLDNSKNGLYAQWKDAQTQLKEFKTSFLSQSLGQLADRNLDQVAETLFKGLRDEKIILSTLGDLANQGLYGKNQTKLLQNILKARYRQFVTKTLPEDAGVSVAGQPRTVTVGGQRFSGDTLEAAGHQKFLDEHGPWVKALFPDDPNFDKFGDVVARSSGLKGRYAKIANIEKELKELPWLKNQKIDDLSRLAIEEPNKLFDLALNTKLPSRSIKQLNRVLKKGLEPEEYAVAQGRMKALALRRIWNPTDEFAATKTGGFSLPKYTDESLGILEKEKDTYIEIFGKEHYDNLRELFPLMKAVDSPPDRGVAGMLMSQMTKKAESGWARLAFLPIKVWVGVLNRKARALNMGSKWLGAGTERRFEHLLSNADALARVLKMRKNVTGKLAANALGSVLAISEDEAQELIDTYTIRDAQGNIIPAPVMSAAEGRSEAINRMMSQ
jgi:hypothetical protein